MTRIQIFPDESDDRALRTKVLFIDYVVYEKPIRHEFHAHACWQLEYILKGEIGVEWTGGAETLAPGSFFFLPPNASHRFVYPKGESRSLSIKFSAEPEPTSASPGSPGGHPLLISLETSFRALFPEDSGEWLREHERLRLLPHLLSALLEIHLLPKKTRQKKTGLIEKIRDCVADTSGRKMTIQSLAKELGYSPGHLSARFHSLAGLPLKTYIDRERARIAGEFLRYADLPISEIAARLGFSDGLSFSHFCRRNLGKSPRAWRKDSGGKN